MNPVQPALRTIALAGFLGALHMAASAPAAADDDPAFLSIGAGYYDILDSENAAEFRIEYRGATKYWIFKPFAGMTATSDAAIYPYGGVLTDFYFGRRLVVSPSIAVGPYFDGDGRDLGHIVEFRSGIEAAYRFDSRARLGLLFYHISNAGFDDDHAGTEVLSLTYSIPLN